MLWTPTITYTYDENGNTIRKENSSTPSSEDVVFAYDAADRMVQAYKGTASTLLGQYDYDYRGLRIRQRYGDRGDTDYVYDGNTIIEERNPGTETDTVRYHYGDRLISLETAAGKQYYHHDALGSTVNLTDAGGDEQVSYVLDPWGHITGQTGTSVNRQIFTGQEHDEKTGLIYFGARYYDPDTARFMTQDPWLGEPGTPPSLHRYLYAYSNPTVYIDLMGYRSAFPDEEKEMALREEAAKGYQASYEAKGVLGKLWDRFYGADYEKMAVLRHLNSRQKIAIESAADGEAVIAVPRPENMKYDINLGNGTTKVTNSEFLTAREAKCLQQYYNLVAAEGALAGSIAMAIDPDNTAAIQIAAAAWDAVSNATVAILSRNSNPTTKMIVEPNGPVRPSKRERKERTKEYLKSLPDVMKQKVMDELSTKNTWQAQESFKRYNSDIELNLELTIETLFGEIKGMASDSPHKKTWVSILGTENAHDTAGVAAHESRHIMQEINKRLPNGQIDPKYVKSFRHEIEAYRWQRDAGFLDPKHWTDRRIYLHVRGRKYYQELYKDMIKQHDGKAPPWTSWFDD